MPDEDKYLQYLKRVTADLRQTRRELRETRERAHEPIAVVGMGCRYPGGVTSPEELWELLERGGDAISEFPRDRGWDLDALAGSATAEGGFLHEAGEFDAGFFGMSPREALATDPQQRLMLEVSWEALERAGIDPSALRGSRSGVFVGAATSGYGVGVTEPPEGIEGYLMTGGATSVISGRVAYSLGWEGPVATVDTACSSSLVALHWAVRALRRGECDRALAGGVAVMATPAMFAQFSAQGGLSSDGRCKAFADCADGTGWSEGAGVVLLERLSDARRLGHPVVGLIRGTAINSDGASNGLTAPNGPAQQRVIRSALEDAELEASDVDAVDAHGTGTTLGDPIEAQALLATYGAERDEPLRLGALKSNLGHTQSAAGVGGIIKMLMAMRHGTLPRTLHVDEPSSHVDWSDGSVSLLTEQEPWPSVDRPKRAAVSSFGISGTNAHTVLEQTPDEAFADTDREDSDDEDAEAATAASANPDEVAAPTVDQQITPWVLSARSSSALAAQAARLVAFAESSEADTASLARSLATTRQAFEHRAVLLGSDRGDLVEAARRLAAGESAPGVLTGTTARGRTVALFPGQGSQYAGMGRELRASSPAFAAALDEVCRHLDPHLDRPLREVLFDPDSAELDQTGWTQPALFAVEVALFRLWESWGVVPQLLLGHSVGSIAAAHVSGVLGLSDACALVAARGRVMQALPEGGAMVAVEAPEDQVRDALIDREERVGVAAVNGPRATVISGDEDAVELVAQRFADEGVRTTRLRGSHAFHSPRMEPALEEFRRVVEGVTFGRPRIPIISDLTGTSATEQELTSPEYWVRHARQTVRFAEAVETARTRGASRFVEVGPGSALTSLTRGIIDDDRDLVLVPGLRRDRPELRSAVESAARLHIGGAGPVWERFFAGWGGDRVDLPTYAFQHERFWLTPTAPQKLSTEDNAFWDAVQREDAESLSRTLGVADGPALREVLPALSSWHRQQQLSTSVNGLCYRVRWEPVSSSEAVPGGTWIALLPGEPAACELADSVVAGLRGAGLELGTVEAADATNPVELAEALAELPEPAGIVSLLALDTTEHDSPLTRGMAATIAALQALDGLEWSAPVWCLTSGAVTTGRADPAPDPDQAAVWGAGRVAALERPRSWGGLVDVPAALDDRGHQRLAAVLAGDEDQVAVRSSAVLARRLAPQRATSAGSWQPRGTVLVTGGTGALGAHVARWCADRGAERLVLTSRRGSEAPGAAELAEELRGRGAEVVLAACDAADRDSLAAVLAEHPVNAVVHAAGVDDQTPLSTTSAEEFAAALRGKVSGAQNLHELLAEADLDAFVLFSSIAGVWGAAGQAAYAAANAHLDALAQRRRAAGQPATAVAWGPWAGSGMAADASSTAHLQRRGLRGLDPQLALAGLERVVGLDEASTVVADVDWDRFYATFAITGAAPLFSGLISAPDTPATAAVAHSRAEIRQLVLTGVAAVLGHADASAVEPGRNFQDLGFDSLTAVELRNRLEQQLNQSLPPGLVFDHPTPEALTDHLTGLTNPADARAAEPARAEDDPVVIVSLGCRFPGGAHSPDQLWELLDSGRDVMGPPPQDRGWDAETSAGITGGFLQDAAGFDAGFFGISPREALAMDPQQRILLETTWEALERAHIDPQSLRGSRTGVFVGTNGADYAGLVWASPEDTEGHASTGNASSVLSGRIAYALGLEGPAVTLDTACSSSLVALHWAAHALRGGECDLAVAAGATVMATPGAFTEFGRHGGLAPDGRCKAFSADADGTSWSEGAGLVLLERLSDARTNGHPVLAVLRGSAVNQDGASNGLTAPNGPAQQRVIQDALDAAGLQPSDVDAVEAHGTGTTLGDPIEAQALAATYGRDREQPLVLGSVKSQLGHTQAAAGAAGVAKMVLALQHGRIPATLHADEPTRHIDWNASRLALARETTAWPESDRPRRAGISSFGISGTNAHVILEQAEPESPGAEGDGAAAWILSAHNQDALREHAANLLDHPAAPGDIAHSLTLRPNLQHRAVTTGRQALEALAAGQEHPELVSGAVEKGGLALVFSGQGSQRPGTGRELAERHPVFAEALDEVCAHLDQHLDRPLRPVLFEADAEVLDDTGWTQPALFAQHVALFRLLESWGVRPDVLLGHSIGELSAAHVAGVLALPDAARLVAERGRLMGELPSGGAMLAVSAPEQDLLGLLGEGVDVAAANSASSTVLSGRSDELESLNTALTEAGHRTQWLRVSHAFHSPLVDPMLAEFRETAASVELQPPTIPVVSTLTGTTATDEQLTDPDYWVEHARRTVRLADAVATARSAHQVSRFLEVTPHTSLAPHIDDAVSTLRHGTPEHDALVRAVAALWTRGSAVDWQRIVGRGNRVALPTLPFQHRRFWPRPPRRPRDAGGHPLLGTSVEVASGEQVFSGELSLTEHPWLGEHVIGEQVLLPGTAMLDMAAHAARTTGCARIAELTLHSPLVLDPDSTTEVQLVAEGPDDDGHRRIALHSRQNGQWQQHASGELAPAAEPAPAWDWPDEPGEIDISGLHPHLEELGYAYGPLFRSLRSACSDGTALYCEAELPEPADGYELHPALLDSLLHPLVLTGGRDGLPSGGGVPFSFTDVDVHAAGAQRVFARVRAADPDGITLDLADEDGEPLARIAHLRQRQQAPARPGGLHQLVWSAVAEITDEGPAEADVVPVWSWDLDEVRSPLNRVRDLLQQRLSEQDPRPLVLTTRGAVATGPAETPDPVQAAVWGLVRSAQSEHPGLFTLLDLDADEPAAAATCLRNEVPQAALRSGELLVPRWEPAEPAAIEPPDGPWRIGVPATASLADLSTEPAPEAAAPLAPGHVRIGVRAAGLNFRDVLNALGMYPGEAGLLGGEVAGVVTEVADDVTDLHPGEAVMGMVAGAFGPAVVADRRLVTAIPEGWSYTQAATAPLVFLTAYYSLVDLADLRPGEKLLVHAATGGVGTAAVQLAQHLGARVLGTAHPSKWPLLRRAGLAEEDIASSRTTEFAAQFPQVDVVLNALTGDQLEASLDQLGTGGRFLEMGKTDVRDPAELAERGIDYRAFDTMDAGPDRLAEILAELGRLFASGALRPLPVTCWDMRSADQAFRHLAQARHTGKVALTAPHAPDPEGTVVITGGTGGLGARFARDLAERGHRDLLLASRRGPDAPGASELLAELEAAGARARIVACDLTGPGAVAELFAQAPSPVTAVLHAAGVLRDTTITNLTESDVDEVLRPKLDAALALDRHTRELAQPCELVLFSSIAGTLGSPGQGNYAAANAALDALAVRRAHDGHPARSLAWGPWSAGMTDSLSENRLENGPLAPLAPEHGLALHRSCAQHPRPDLIAAPLNPGHAQTHPMLAHRSAKRSEPRSQLGEHELLDLVRSSTATVLGYAGAEDIAPQQNFQDLGTDSLTAVELRNRLSRATGLRLPATLLFDHPTPQVLADHLGAQLAPKSRERGPARAQRRRAEDDPIVITSLGCHFPPAITAPEQLWELLAEGGSSAGPPPTDRGWDTAHLPPTIGGHLQHASSFDHELFNVAPKEALTMDPQQRVLLHTTWETLERAQIDPRSLRGSRTGVFVGTNYQGYGSSAHAAPEEGTSIAGHAASVTSGRIAYTFGFEGPAITVDTACSSSSVALHWAAQSLRSGECELALAGGITVMATPGAFAEFDKHGGLAPDGRCKPFSADADGTSWSEGAGLVLLERLSDARANGHPVLAVLRGSAVNQDGASNGLTAPNGPAQQRVIQDALDAAGLQPSDVDAVEAHGTGTTLGDPIEAQALAATYGQDRSEPLLLGSIKSNLGHTQAAAGVAGVLKMVLALQRGEVPPTLHAANPTGHLDWDTSNLRLAQEPTPWPEVSRPRRAAVSSFGISGTNTHVILEQAPEPDSADSADSEDAQPQQGPFLWPLSARGEAALQAQARRLAAHVREHEPDPAALARSLADTRATLPHRACVVGSDRDELLDALGSLSRGEGAAALRRSPSEGIHASTRTAFLFSGQGAQRAGAGAELTRHPVFAESYERVCAALDRHLDRPLREITRAAPGTAEAELLDRTEYTQPALFAFEVAAHDLLRAWGAKPDFLLGHSVGELAAAHVAGAVDLDDAARLVTARGRLMQALPGHGVMIAVAAGEDEVRELVDEAPGVDVAAVNAAGSVVLSGWADATEQVAQQLAEKGRKTRRLRTSHAFHSAQMDAMLSDFEQVAAGVTWSEPRVPLVSDLTGELLTAEEIRSPQHWVRHARETIRFADGVRTLVERGVGAMVELGPDAVLTPAAAESAPACAVTPIARRGHDEWEQALGSVAELHVHGCEVDLAAVCPQARRIDLPTYAFQGSRFWLDNAPAPAAAGGQARFWEAVERGELPELLSLPPDAPVRELQPALAAWHRQEQRREEVGAWEYAVEWVPVAEPDPAALSGTWVLVGEQDDPVAAQVGEELTRAGASVLALTGSDRASLASSLPAEARGVVATLDLAGTLALVQAIGDAGLDAALWSVTRAAVTTGADGIRPNPEAAAIWGAGRVAALEHPQRWGGLVDLPEQPDRAHYAHLVSLVDGHTGEDQLAVRPDGFRARRLHRCESTGEDWEPTGTVLITGGSGALGLRAARRVAERGAHRVVLVSRRGSTAETDRLAAELEPRGTTVTTAACDVTDPGAVQALLDKLRADGPPLRAVVHTAGLLDDAPLDDLTAERVEAVLAPKATAAAVLDRATREDDLAAFVLFSSLAGSVGGMGQANYAAANAALDALAQTRRSAGLPATSIAWGPWAGGGMADERGMRRAGLEPLDPELALDAMQRITGSGRAAAVVADVAWETFARGFAGLRPAPLLADLPEVAALSTGAEAPSSEDLLRELAELSGPDRVARLVGLVRSSAAAALGFSSPEGVPAQRAFTELGFDSLMAVRLRNSLAAATGLALPSTLLFDHPSAAALGEHLAGQLDAGQLGTGQLDTGGQRSVLTELDRLEALLNGAREAEREQVAGRLRDLLDRWSGERAPAAEQLSGASADELFEFIDKDLGL